MSWSGLHTASSSDSHLTCTTLTSSTSRGCRHSFGCPISETLMCQWLASEAIQYSSVVAAAAADDDFACRALFLAATCETALMVVAINGTLL